MSYYRHTGSDHRFETGLLVNARPKNVACWWPPVSECQETQRQAHSSCHGHHKAWWHTSNTCVKKTASSNKFINTRKQISPSNHVTFTAKSENIQHYWIGDLVEETGASSLRLNSSNITRAADAMDQSKTENWIWASA